MTTAVAQLVLSPSGSLALTGATSTCHAPGCREKREEGIPLLPEPGVGSTETLPWTLHLDVSVVD